MVRINKNPDLSVQQHLKIPVELRRKMIMLHDRGGYPSLNALMLEAIENLIKSKQKPKKGE